MATLMACYHPLTAYRAAGGGITFREGGDSGPELELPCGRCIGCRIKRTREWAMRCMHEASLHDQNSFVTLTYDDDHYQPGLDYKHFQTFIRALRRTRPVRFFCAGEYGEKLKRPHWHALLFGVGWTNTFPVGMDLLGSHDLEKLWPYGFSSIGEVTPQSAAYVASYCVKKKTGPLANEYYKRVHLMTGEIIEVRPEMARMSLKPGIGQKWIERYWPEVYGPRDSVIGQQGSKAKPPRYYDQQLLRLNSTCYTDKETDRQLDALTRRDDNTRARLAVKEQVAIAKQKMKLRKLD